MTNRKFISECLVQIYQEYNKLEETVNNKSDQELDEILRDDFLMYVTNIHFHFEFLQMMISRVNEDADPEDGCRSLMTNEELIDYFDKNWDLVIEAPIDK